MKKNLLLRALIFCALPFGLKAQVADDKRSAVSLVVKANNLYHFSKKPLNSYYSLGGEIGVYFNDKLYMGLAQYSSLSPSDIWQNSPHKPDKVTVYEYSLQLGYKFELASPLYIYTGLRAGYGAMHIEYRYKNGVDSDETMTREKLGAVFVTPDFKLGVKVHKYVDIEAGLNYTYHIGSKDKLGLHTDTLNGLSTVVSVVGNIPL